MLLEKVDWIIVASFFALSLLIGVVVARRAGSSSSEFFLSGRNMPWWLLGFSMVATTFSTDTPNLVTDIVRQKGVAGNWVWWAFLLTGMLTVFVYARLWRRSGVTTDVEFYELRYSGKPAAFLRGFRALYLGVFFNVLIMAAVTLAAIKIGRVMLGFSPIETILVAAVVTVIFSVLGGLRAVLITDFILFIIAMVGAVAAAYVALGRPEVGGLSGMLSSGHLEGKLSILPALENPDGTSNIDTFVALLILPLAVQWWSVWYPGAEPGGGGYLAQRMLSAKNEKHAMGATLFFNSSYSPSILPENRRRPPWPSRLRRQRHSWKNGKKIPTRSAPESASGSNPSCSVRRVSRRSRKPSPKRPSARSATTSPIRRC